jgi:hypothetical protein
MALFEIDKRSDECAYITMGNLTVYLDNSTGEQIIHIWKTVPNTGQMTDIYDSYFDIEKQKRVKA